MRRREFISLLGGAAVAWPLAARAQQAVKLPTIGFLGTTTPSSWGPWVAAFAQRLRDLGWTEHSTVTIEYRWAEGRNERFAEIAAEFVRLKVDVIVTSGGAVIAVKQATSTIPIVFAVADDPVGSGLVASLARPGGNVTGLSLQRPMLPASDSNSCARLSPVSVVWPYWPMLAIQPPCWRWTKFGMARALDIQVFALEIRRAEDIPAAFETAQGSSRGFYVCTDPLISTHRIRINTLAAIARLPTMHSVREYVEAGGLMSYGASYPDLFRRAADFVDKILRGAKPGDIPVEQPTKFDLVVDLTTAKALGLDVPPTLLATADEVIE